MMFRFKSRTYQQLSDEKLTIFISNGDVAAFNELYNRYNERILYYFYRMLWNDKELAQDFLQDLFMKIIDKLNTFSTDRKFSTWVFSIAHNMCKNEYRKRQIRALAALEPDVACDAFDDETAVYSALQIEDVFDCLNDLDELHRTAFLLKYREGLSIEAIGAVLDLPVGTVKSRLFYTRKKIQKDLIRKLQICQDC